MRYERRMGIRALGSGLLSRLGGRTRLDVLVATAIVGGAVAFSAYSQAPAAAPSPITRKVLNTVDVPNSTYQVIEVKVEIAPNSAVPKHTHPGTVIGYVLEGDYSIRLEGQPAKAVAPGETFTIPTGVPHEELTGAHAAKIIAVFTVEKGKPLSSPVP